MGPFRLIGPIAGWELRRLARRGTAMRVRLVLVYTLFLAFIAFAIYTLWPSARSVSSAPSARLSLHASTNFAEEFTLIFLLAQLAVVIAISPGLAAVAVAEEKDRHTLPPLLTTTLTDSEIIFGKAAGQIVFGLSVVFAGLPVLMLTLFFGGVSLGLVLAGYALTAGTVVLCAASGMNAACQSPDLRSALLWAYGYTVLLVCAPIGLLLALVERDSIGSVLLAGVAFPMVQLAVATGLLFAATQSLRLGEVSAGPRPVTAFPEPPRPADPPFLLPDREPIPQLPPVDEANPVLWKERCVGWRPEWSVPVVTRPLGTLVAVLAILLFVGGAWTVMQRLAKSVDPDADRLIRPSGTPDLGGWLLVGAAMFATGRYLLPLTVGVTGAIAGERRRGTLDVLLSTTLARGAILRAKVWAHAERGLIFAAGAIAALGMAFIVDGGVRLGLAAAALVVSGIWLVIALGAWLTVRCATDVRAFRFLLPVTVLVIGWPAGVWNLLVAEPNISAGRVLWGLLIASGACAVIGAVFWWLACMRLNRGE
ncbi:MAG: ABC transporter permease [Planctomycetia bacterium]|nr:ABC transporter permease [Planctomycetia bacterium]